MHLLSFAISARNAGGGGGVGGGGGGAASAKEVPPPLYQCLVCKYCICH